LNGTSGYISDGIGNYSTDVKCSWLIEAGNSTNSTIRLHFEEFITECGWDHLYIYDGDSVHSPLLGVYRFVIFTYLCTQVYEFIHKFYQLFIKIKYYPNTFFLS
jgi:hypothetical protein